MSVSHWKKAAATGRGDERYADLCIIGAGIAGLSLARLAAHAGLDVVVLERRQLGSGASGRNAGYLMRGAAANYHAAAAEWGREPAKALWRLSERSPVLLERLDALKNADAIPCPSCLLPDDVEEAAALERSLALLREDGFDVERLRDDVQDDAVTRGMSLRGGLVNPHDMVCDPLRVLRNLAASIENRLLERAEAYDVEPTPRGLTVHALRDDAALRVHAAAVAMCTNAAADAAAPELIGALTPNRAQMLTIDVSDGWLDGLPLKRAYYVNRGSDYIRQFDPHTIGIGGRRTTDAAAERTLSDNVTPTVQHALEHAAAELLGVEQHLVARNVRARWAGAMAFTPTGLPILDRVGFGLASADELDRRVRFLGGFTGHGMSLAPALAELALRRIAQETLGRQLDEQPALVASPHDESEAANAADLFAISATQRRSPTSRS